MPVRVVIVDDHPAFREQARGLLPDGWSVVGEAADGEQALAQVGDLAPALVLLDVQLPDTDGFSLAQRLQALRPGLRVVLTSARDARHYRRRLAGSALPFVAKEALSAEALTAAARP